MKEFMSEVNYYHHHKTLERINTRRPNLSRRLFRLKKSPSNKNDKVFKTSGHFQIRGQVINEDQYFDQAHKLNILLAKRIQAIEHRKPDEKFLPLRKYILRTKDLSN
jgi:hypothetical protein